MAKLRDSVEFLADFPDDTVCDDNGDEVQFAGENVARTIAELLTKRGYEVSEPENCLEFGWELGALRSKSRFWMRITKIEEFVIVTQDMTRRLWPKREPFAAFLGDLHAVLQSDVRFSRIRWFQDALPADGGDWRPEPLDS